MSRKIIGFLISLILILILLSYSVSCNYIENQQFNNIQPEYKGLMFIIGTYDTVNRTPFEIRFQNNSFFVFGFCYFYDDELWAIISDGGKISGGGFDADRFFGISRAGFVCGFMLGNITEIF